MKTLKMRIDFFFRQEGGYLEHMILSSKPSVFFAFISLSN